ncbi:3-hydroxyacyl-CoA dehydrogenase/enoyl-CoA hydratase family protein [bacterium]|nr:3-hydroxyacyl-CoA dehydrogenase/enoyl-CoA hydratase family protein [bacterium]
MSRYVKKVAVLGSGVMGSAIAAHFANAGVPSLVLDIVPPDLENAAEAGHAARNAIADGAVKAMVKTKPAPLFTQDLLALIETGNFEDDFARIADADWVIEVVKEDLAIKKKVLAAASGHLGPAAWLSSNTSGLSLAAMAEVLPAQQRPRFLGTHFFNPPRYMKLLELIPTADTDPAVLAAVADFAEVRLGKGIVLAKDTPNFIANRIGVHAMMVTMRVMAEMGLTIEEVDALTGPAVGRPKTATFKLADLVGLDTFLHVADNVREAVAGDEARDVFDPPPFLRTMVEKGLLGRKSGGGFYKMIKQPEKTVLTLDLETFEFRDKQKARFPEIEQGKTMDDLVERLRFLVFGKGRGSEAIWKMLAPSLSYSAMRLAEICEEASAIDRAVRWGFNWDLGPFETWDALGFRKVTERLREDGLPLPGWIDALYDEGAETIYRTDGGTRESPTAEPGAFVPVPVNPRVYDFEFLRRAGGAIRENPGASLLDLGDGIFCIEFHSKMNAIGQDHIQMVMTGCDEAERNGRALVVANQGEHFSAGANLMLLLMEAMEGNWEDIDMIVRAFQGMNDRLAFCRVPVVAAPHGLALGGGCEVTMAGDAVRAAAETYIGLVEFGAGVVPAGGGCARLYQRHVALLPDRADLYPALKAAFETIGMAKVATSAAEGRQLGFLRPADSWSMNRDLQVADAKVLAAALAESGYAPPLPEPAVPVMGRNGVALCESVLFNMEQAGYISEHDHRIGGYLARILSGGDVPGPTTVSHQHLLDLEREYFLKLCGERRTLERMQSLLKTGKPLRN